MLYFLYGTDRRKSRAKLHELLGILAKKRPQAEVFRITGENWSEGQFDELLGSQGLFEQKYIVILDGLFDRKDVKEYILDRLSVMKESSQVFLSIEEKADAAALKKLEAAAEKVQEFSVPEKKESPKVFAVADGLKERDKRKLWVSYVTLLADGVSAEEIHGVMFWQVKNMILASRSQSQKETGLSPFVYSQALSGARKYKTEELLALSSDLLEMSHKVRQGKGDLDIMLEKRILEI